MTSSNILITGSKGQLGLSFKEVFQEHNFSDNLYFTDINELDICNHKNVKDYIVSNKIDVIINCAAFTAVDNAEIELHLAENINHYAVENLAMISKERNIKLIHISTDYVFDGKSNRPYSEEDETIPKTNYGLSKLNGELAIKKINPRNSIIIRTSWLYSKYSKNFAKTIIKMSKDKSEIDVIIDQVGSPTSAYDLALFIAEAIPKINNDNPQIYHYSNLGVCSWYDFALAILEFSEIEFKVNPISSLNFNSIAKRPFYSVLSKDKVIKKFNLEIPHWRESLRNTLKKNNYQ